MIANLITMSRVVLLFGTFLIMDNTGFAGHVLALVLITVVIVLDGIDGIVARRLKEDSEFGSVFDIVVDRIVENCIWIYFAAKGVISFWIPIVVLTRGILTDGVRSVALARGMTAFGEKTLQRSLTGRALVSSRTSRGLYGFSKVAAFLSLVIIKALDYPETHAHIPPEWRVHMTVWGFSAIYLSVVYCVVRGLPVIIDSRDLLRPRKEADKK